jgi:dipeptidyl aminopeptidase/acylaminoacyl peptidase
MVIKLNIVLLIISTVIAYIIITSLWGFYWAIHPPFKILSSTTPAQFDLQYENISFYAKDNTLIKGWFIPSPKSHAKTIILLHGYPADKGDILPSRLFLHKNYNLLFIDFRYLGQSGGNYTTVGQREVMDLLGAIAYLHQRHINEVGVWGLSLGGAVALMTAEKSSAIRAIVSESSYANLYLMLFEYYPTPFFQYPLAWLTQLWAKLFLRIDINTVSPLDSSKKLKIPILLIHSEKDRVVPFSHALLLQQSLHNNPNAQFLFSPQLHHGELSQTNAQEIQMFFAKNL